MTILTLNGSYFVEGAKALAETLFNPLNGKTAAGYYKRLKGRVMFYKPDGTLFAAFVHNAWFTGLVSASSCDGKLFYMHGLATIAESAFGLSELSYGQVKAYEQSLISFVK